MSDDANDKPNHHPQEVTLSRDLSLFTITMIGVGGMIGAGIFALTGIAAGVAGPALVLVFLFNGIVTTLTAFSYAELASAFPEVGGGYIWVKESLGGAVGFLAGWMDWFAHAVAGSLYALAFGRFASEVWILLDMPTFGLSVQGTTLGFMTIIIALFTTINYRGASETGTVGNVVTLAKLVILVLFVFFGMLFMLGTDVWHVRFTADFLPEGIVGIFAAMGITFIAFEGYEIIAQSGDEAIDPRRNIPRAIFLSVFISVLIYILVSITVIGAIEPPLGIEAYQYLGGQKEVAVVEVARQTFPWGIGAVVLLVSGLVSTMSALNATTYSSSRVSFAMGRDHNLPSIFAHVHPWRYTPHWAVLLSGGLMLIMAWSLPIEDVAAAASIMFLLLFIQVNLAVMAYRRKVPEVERQFRIPWFPAVPIIAIICNALLALYLFTFSPIAWYFTIGWILIGSLAYYAHFSKIEAMEKPKEIMLEEVLVSRDYSVVVPVSTHGQARILGKIGAIIARDKEGEVLALNVVMVPPQLTLGEGRLMLKEGRAHLETVIQQGKERDVPIHTVLRLGRNVPEAIRKTVEENAADLLLLGWPGYTQTTGRIFGSISDLIIDNPPTDIALVRYRAWRPLRSILVPVAGGPNTRLAIKLAVSMARGGVEQNVHVTLLHVVPSGVDKMGRAHAEQILSDACETVDYDLVECQIVTGADVAETILKFAKGRTGGRVYDLIVTGATNEPLLKNLLLGNITERIAREAEMTVIVVKRRSSRLHSFLRQTVLEPSTNQENSEG